MSYIMLLRIAMIFSTSTVSAATAFVPRVSSKSNRPFPSIWKGHGVSCPDHVWKISRGGDQDEQELANDLIGELAANAHDQEPTATTITSPEFSSTTVKASTSAASVPIISKIAGVFATVGKTYSQSLETHPILTKSCTAGIIFGLSDYLAQVIEARGDQSDQIFSFDWTRLISTTLVGLLYFGPAAHYWYEWIFRLLPGIGLASTLYKAFWGQVLFGPSFTCIFFATSLLQAGELSLSSWWAKIRTDLPGAWLAGVGYWPIVDFISYSIVPVKMIPLFVNMASLIWTVYLSLVANNGTRK